MAQIHATLGKPHMNSESYAVLIEHGLNPEFYFTVEMVDEADYGFISSLKHSIADNAFKTTFHMPYIDTNIGDINADTRARSLDRFLASIELASNLGSQLVIAHPGFGKMPSDDDFSAWLDRAVDSLIQIVTTAKDLQLPIAFENIYDSEPYRLIEILNVISEPTPFAGICFDLGHFNMFSTLPMTTWLKAFDKRVLVCHLHDNDRSGDQHKPIGDGCINFSPFVEWYKKLDLCQKPILTFESASCADILKSVSCFKSWGI